MIFELPIAIILIVIIIVFIELARIWEHNTALKLLCVLVALYMGITLIGFGKVLAEDNAASANVLALVDDFYTTVVYVAIAITGIIIVLIFKDFILMAKNAALNKKKEKEEQYLEDEY